MVFSIKREAKNKFFHLSWVTDTFFYIECRDGTIHTHNMHNGEFSRIIYVTEQTEIVESIQRSKQMMH